MKKFLAVLLVLIMALSIFTISYADSNQSKLYGVWINEDSLIKVLFITKSFYTYSSYNPETNDGSLETFSRGIYLDSENPNRFYFLASDNNIYKLTLSDDGSTLSYGYTDTSDPVIFTRK